MLNNNLRVGNKQDIPPLTGLRFFAAFLVCAAHVIPYVMPGAIASVIKQFSAMGMTLFFVLSGFVIHYNYSALIRENPGLGTYNFLISRFARLYPLYFFCLSLDLIKNYGYSTLSPTFGEAIPYYLTLVQSWFYIPMGQHALIYQFGLMPSVAWSVSTEWFFYIMYPLICFGILKLRKTSNKISFLSIFCMVMPIIVVIIYFHRSSINFFAIHHFGFIADNAQPQDSFFRWLIYFSPYSRISEFIVGCLTASIYMHMADKKPSQREERIGFIVLICSLISVTVFYYAIFYLSSSVPHLAWLITLHQCFGFAPSVALIIFCSARYKNIVSKFLSNPTILLGGEISYSMYLLHLPIAEAFSRDAAPATNWIIGFADASRLLIAFAAILGTAFISYKTIEVPARRMFRNLLTIRERKYVESV